MTIAAYDAIAEWYDQRIREGALLPHDTVVTSHLFEALGTIDSLVICDLACGQGKMARLMAQRGAKVVGIDVSEKLLNIARAEEAATPQGITYLRDDARWLASLDDRGFDGVLCHMALMDIPDLDATFQSVRRILRPGGWFAFTITHPCFQKPPDRSYYEEGFWRSNNPHGVRGQVGAQHRTLSTYVNALTNAGIYIKHLGEPPLPGRDLPVILLALCRIKQIPV